MSEKVTPGPSHPIGPKGAAGWPRIERLAGVRVRAAYTVAVEGKDGKIRPQLYRLVTVIDDANKAILDLIVGAPPRYIHDLGAVGVTVITVP